MARAKTLLAAALVTVVFSDVSFGQAGVAAPPPPTLWSFLGIPQGMRKVRGALTNRRGNTPRTEPKVPMKALNDPANLESENPAIKKAAEIKQEEDAKPQKIKAIKYLTSIGCGCYDKDGSVSDALVAAAEDCTEDVRLTTMQKIREAACGKCCANCGQICCCNEKILKKLAELAYEKDEFGCYVEPSARVRAAAAEALAACCPGSPPLEILSSEEDDEPEEIRARPEEQDDTLQAVPETEGSNSGEAFYPGPARVRSANRLPSSTKTTGVSLSLSDLTDFETSRGASASAARQLPVSVTRAQPATTATGIARMRQLMIASPPKVTVATNPEGGVVMAFDPELDLAYVHFADQQIVLPVGATVHLRQDPSVGTDYFGSWQVVEADRGCANLYPVEPEREHSVRVGDQVDLGPPPVNVAPISFVRSK